MAGEMIQSVARAFSVMEQLSKNGDMGVRELQASTKFGVATVHRILSTLNELGYVRQDASTGRYGLTYKVLALGNSVTVHNEIVQLVHPLLKELSDELEETVHFVERTGMNIRYIDKVVPSVGVVVTSSYLGMELPMYSTAVGKAIMADLSDEEVRDIWERSERVAFTPHTVSTFEELKKQVDEVKKTGIAYDLGERETHVFCMAMNILDVTGKPNYAISISCSDSRMKENCERYAVSLRAAKKRLTNLIGYSLGGI